MAVLLNPRTSLSGVTVSQGHHPLRGFPPGGGRVRQLVVVVVVVMVVRLMQHRRSMFVAAVATALARLPVPAPTTPAPRAPFVAAARGVAVAAPG